MNWIASHWSQLSLAAWGIFENVLPYTPLKANSTVQLIVDLVKLFLPKPVAGGAFVEVTLHYGFGQVSAQNTFATSLHITDLSPALATKALTGKKFNWDIIPAQWLHAMELGDGLAKPWDEVKQYLREEK